MEFLLPENNKEILSNETDPLDLPADLIDIAFKEFGETKELRARKLFQLKQLIADLPEEDRIPDTSDVNLIRFLRGRKYDMDIALSTTVNLVRFNREHPEWTENHTAKEFKDFAPFFQLLKKTDKGRVVVVFRPSVGIKILTPEFMEANPLAIIRSMLWFINKMSFNVYAQVCGGLLLESFEGFTLWDNITIAQACPLHHQIAAMTYVQNCIGFRFCGAYLFHEPSFITWLWYLAKGFLNERVRNRFHLCGTDLSQVHKEFSDVRMRPVYYGGEVQDGDYDFVMEQIVLEKQMQMRMQMQCEETTAGFNRAEPDM